MSSFFTFPSSQKKRKRSDDPSAPKKRFISSKSTAKPQTPALRTTTRDDSISGSDDESDLDSRPRDSDNDNGDAPGSSSDEDEAASDAETTAAERRLKLAERYLQNIRSEVDEVGFDAEEIDRDLIAERLQEDAAESKGLLYRKLAADLEWEDAMHCSFGNDAMATTGVVIHDTHAYTVSKDICLVKWKLMDLPDQQWKGRWRRKNKRPPPPPRRKPVQLLCVKGDRTKSKDSAYKGHTASILCIAISPSGHIVVTGGEDRKIIIWDTNTLSPLKIFTQHRDAVTGLAFRRGTNQLYSSSKDRTIKIWSLDELAYVETLFGHQDEVVDIAALAMERCISVGARDRTARLWKVVEETQLVFRGGGGGKEKKSKSSNLDARYQDRNIPKILEGSIDRIAMVDEEMFVTGSDNGSLSLWLIHKKKPVFTIPFAHGLEDKLDIDDVSAEKHPDAENSRLIPMQTARWITALKTVPYSDVVLSGSWDGNIRIWRVTPDKKKLEPWGVLSHPYPSPHPHPMKAEGSDQPPVVKGIINDISIFERGERGKDGLCIVAATGKEHRMGRWNKIKGKNGAVVFEVPRISRGQGSGLLNGVDVENEVADAE